MIKSNKEDLKRHVVANIKSETIIDDERETTESQTAFITINPFPILRIMNDHRLVQFSLFSIHWKV